MVRVALLTAAVAAAIGAVALAVVDDRAPAVAARLTARVSFGAFVIAFAIGPLSRRVRDELGVLERRAWAAFVAAHLVHLGYLANNVLRLPDRPPLWRAGGGMAAYAIVAAAGVALLATRDGARAPRLRWLVDLGGLWIAAVFVLTYAGRAFRMMPAPDGSTTAAWPGYLVLLVVAAATPLAHAAIVLTRPRG